MTKYIKGKVGVGITTHNRNRIFDAVIVQWKSYITYEKLVIVDDASDIPCPFATYRFRKNVGISVAKNKCLELLDDCEHIFLSDDDCFPIKDGWADAYITPGIKHLCFTFDKLKNGKDWNRGFIVSEGGLSYYNQPCGCLLYIHHDCLDAVGGMDINFKGWGAEHVDYSRRIYNVGLTPHPFMDIDNSLEYFCSLDYYSMIESASWDNRRRYQAANAKRKAATVGSKKFYPYK